MVWIGVAIAAPTLAGSEWAPSSKSKQFIQFQSGRRIAGHGGCNRFFGSYSQSNGRLTFGPLGSTKMMCPQNIMRKERWLFALLSKVARFDRMGHRLMLFDDAGKKIATFRQRDWD